MKRLALLALAMLASPAAAQITATLPVTCTTSGSNCVSAIPVVNPDGTNIGGGGGSATRSTAAGTSDTQAVPVQGVTNGIPQRITGIGQTASTTAQTVVPATDAPAFPVAQRGAATIATGQVSIGTGSTLLVAARTARARVTISVGAANTCAFGNTGVTATTGFPLQPVAGASVTLDTAAAIYGACSAATTVSYVELF